MFSHFFCLGERYTISISISINSTEILEQGASGKARATSIIHGSGFAGVPIA